jgi:hypothetical protein
MISAERLETPNGPVGAQVTYRRSHGKAAHGAPRGLPQKDGDTVAWVARFRADGQPCKVTIGHNPPWAETRAREQLDSIIYQVRWGVWVPPDVMRLQRALANPRTSAAQIRAVAFELRTVGLEDAPAILVALLHREPQSYSRTAARWAARLTVERRLPLADAQLTLASLAELAGADAGADRTRQPPSAPSRRRAAGRLAVRPRDQRVAPAAGERAAGGGDNRGAVLSAGRERSISVVKYSPEPGRGIT